ncbi:atrial natriuretic peptide receptor 1-like isoform X2 [Littorina saxatilis]|uniref:atrial natriuretic peptide receptor 1-like isoform X2 n=1 Tax=Littorina saxatilis TaxID=31220 RepID=UPI0038B4A47F
MTAQDLCTSLLLFLALSGERVRGLSDVPTCWALTSDTTHHQPYETCPGINAYWKAETLQVLKKMGEHRVSYHLSLNSSFYTCAVAAGHFDLAGPSGFSDSKSAQQWCETTVCPGTAREANQTNCCLHYINVHFCPAVHAGRDIAGHTHNATPECWPWVPEHGAIYTFSDPQAGPVTTGNWTSVLYEMGFQKGSVQVIAVFKVAGIKCAFESTMNISIQSDCGNDECEDDENCNTCPADCGQCTHIIRNIIISIILGISCLASCCVGVVYQFHLKKHRALAKDNSWIISVAELFKPDDSTTTLATTFLGSINSQEDEAMCIMNMRGGYIRPSIHPELFIREAVVKGKVVAVKHCFNKDFVLTDTIRNEVSKVRGLDHTNVCKFVGGTVEKGHIFILFEFCPKGSLSDIIQNHNIPLNWAFRFSLLADVARGMAYLHQHEIVHGRLKPTNCVVDDRWTCKVTDYGLREYRRQSARGVEDSSLGPEDSVYMAPDALDTLTPPSDVYSFGMIMVEVATREKLSQMQSYPSHKDQGWRPDLPKVDMVTGLTLELDHTIGIIKESHQPNNLDVSFTQSYHELIAKCWADKPSRRPRFRQVENAIHHMNPCKRSPVDTMIDLMESYSKNLESLIDKRSKELLEEKQKTDKLLYSILPRRVAEDLKNGKVVVAEWFEDATVFFSDIVSFTSMSARSSPLQIVQLLNQLYTMFDSILERHNVYKVETIGDAYMVVSGVPDWTAHHAYHVAMMSLEIMSASKDFSIPHLPYECLRIRIGFVSANKILITDKTYHGLVKYKTFKFESRGIIQVKGKGEMDTYWLVGLQDTLNPDTADQEYLRG